MNLKIHELLAELFSGMSLEDVLLLPHHERVFIAVEIENEIKRRKTHEKKEKKHWIAKARLGFKPGSRQPCAVCGKYESVTHAHHIKPLHTQFKAPSFHEDYVWLCPTHHEGVHQMLGGKFFAWPDWEGFSIDEKRKMAEIAEMRVA